MLPLVWLELLLLSTRAPVFLCCALVLLTEGEEGALVVLELLPEGEGASLVVLVLFFAHD